MEKAEVVRLARAVGLALAVWPVLGSGGGTDMGDGTESTSRTSWQFPEVGRCQASSLPRPTLAAGRDWDANGVRCVGGNGDCPNEAP
jgi:hypothetical protein